MVALSLGIGFACTGLVSAQADRVSFPTRSELPPNRFRRRQGGDSQQPHHVISTTSNGNDRRHMPSSSVPATALATDSDLVDSQQPANEGKPTKYHFLVANAKFMLDEEEHFMEQLYERLRLFKERNREQDFWLVIEPKFLDKFPSLTKRLKRPAVALVSTDAIWIKFMKLRLDRVLMENFEAAGSLEDALACNVVDLHFEKPATWTAPYPKYEFGWWEPFLPPKA